MKIDKSKLLGFSNITMPSVPMVGIKPGDRIERDLPPLPPQEEELLAENTNTDSESDIADTAGQEQSDSSDNSEIA